MDRRKLQSRNVLHKKLYSSSQTSVNVASSLAKENIIRSASAVDSRFISRKRKNSEDEDEKKNLSLKSSRMTPESVRKKKRNHIIDDDNDDDDDENDHDNDDNDNDSDNDSDNVKKRWNNIFPMRLSMSKLHAKGEKHNKLSKPIKPNFTKKLQNNLNYNDTKEESDSSGGSYIRGMLEALDKSPSKLSQSSNTSFDKYRKPNLRTPIRSKLKKSALNLTIERYKEAATKSSQESLTGSQIKKLTLNKSMEQRSKKNNDLDNEENSYSLESDASVVENDLQEIPSLSQTNQNNHDDIDTSPVNNYSSNGIIKKFTNFINEVGITLCLGDNLHIANDDPREIIQKMKNILSSNNLKIDEIVKSWNNYINDEENLKKTLLEMKIETAEGIGICSKALSLSRFLLQIPQLQIKIFESLFTKLIDAVITSDSSDDAPWAVQMFQQFRFLEIIVDSDFLIAKLEELLSSSPEWYQREVIVFIPDIITDTHHHATAEMLIKIMKNSSDLTNLILDCINNLILSKEYKEELREHVLELLDNSIDKKVLPAITRFILDACATESIALKSLNALRLVDMTTSVQKEIDECHTIQMFMINAIKINIQLFKETSQAALSMIKNCQSEAVPLDIIILILLYETTVVKKKIIETTLISHIKDGYYKANLLNALYTGHKQVVKNFQPTALNLAINLLKAESSAHVEFGIEWLRNIFISQSDTSYKQREVLEKLLNLMGNKNKTVKNALEVLCRMANDETERQYFQQHAGFLRCFLEKIDNLQFDEVAMLYHLLHGLCTQSELISNILNDDLTIIMQKQLCSSKVITKCKGVLGAVMAIKHLAVNNETNDQASQLLKNTLYCLKSCVKSQALFYDQLGQVITNTDNIDDQFLSDITNFFEDNFINNCLVECNNDNNLVPKFGLNNANMVDSYYVHFGSGKTGAFVPVFFKLLRICNLRLSGSLESINAVLGCSILMPEDLNMPEPSTADYIIHCINWFREIIGGFVTQKETLLREQVLKRLNSLMNLQGELVTILSMCESRYQPPPCYFHHFPIPQFVKMDIKVGKKGNKRGKKKKKIEDEEKDQSDLTLNRSILLPEWENWVVGSELTIKNPVFFRQMDTKIINLLDTNMDIESSQTSSENITIAQVCFIVKELLGMFKNQLSESFVKNLIQLLPKICAKLKQIITDLRECERAHEKEAVQLLLCLLITLFSWDEFKNVKYNLLFCDGLRSLIGMTNESGASSKSQKDLIAQAYSYFESLADIATQISIAVALVNMCNCLMKHSVSFIEQSRERQAKMAFGFLNLEWNNETHGAQYKNAIKELLKMWLDNEVDPLETVNSIFEWLPMEVEQFKGPQSRLSRLASITKSNFYLLFKQLFVSLVKGVDLSLNLAETDPERLQVWLNVATCLEKMANICKSNKNNIYLVLFLRYTTILYQLLLTSGMKLLEANIKYQTEKVLSVIKHFQISGRFLRDIFCTARKDKNVTLLKLIPIAKSRREKFIYRVKGLLTANNSISAFWMGNLLNKDLDGEEIPTDSPEDVTTDLNITNESNANDKESDIFYSDSDEDDDDDN
ncbi:PREDICTED: Fanconi anemia group D2 protein homolog [Ceratosolen solmsi marchali]|uniref:Fanconi anemia group D2 protein homolog n=1 Tax=Ceratosolen solmsi marchali TaxID=326594 RepID=A0AAJ7DW34_9HYME|nr:PREDICTED: Fanconi anemia group D2 protein homolog [Ceratosolen solmsi marchali]